MLICSLHFLQLENCIYVCNLIKTIYAVFACLVQKNRLSTSDIWFRKVVCILFPLLSYINVWTTCLFLASREAANLSSLNYDNNSPQISISSLMHLQITYETTDTTIQWTQVSSITAATFMLKHRWDLLAPVNLRSTI